MEKVTSMIRKFIGIATKDRKNTLIVLTAAVLVLSLLMGLVFTPSYKSMLTIHKKAANAKTAEKVLDLTLDADNGFCEKEVRQLLKLLGQTALYEGMNDGLSDSIDRRNEVYGKNFKVRYKLVNKEKMNADELNNLRDSLDSLSERCAKTAENLKDPDKYMEDFVEDLDLSKKEMEKAVKLYEKLAKKLDKAKVTTGYILELDCKITGRNLDDPEEYTTTLWVYKINGKWTCNTAAELIRTLA